MAQFEPLVCSWLLLLPSALMRTIPEAYSPVMDLTLKTESRLKRLQTFAGHIKEGQSSDWITSPASLGSECPQSPSQAIADLLRSTDPLVSIKFGARMKDPFQATVDLSATFDTL